MTTKNMNDYNVYTLRELLKDATDDDKIYIDGFDKLSTDGLSWGILKHMRVFDILGCTIENYVTWYKIKEEGELCHDGFEGLTKNWMFHNVIELE